MQALVEVVKHQKESGFAFLLSTQAGFLPKLPLETSPVGRGKARVLQENVLLWHSYFPRGHLDKSPPNRVQCAPWPEWTPLDASGSEQRLAHLDLSTFWSSTQFFPTHLHRLAHMNSGPAKVCGGVRRKCKEARLLLPNMRLDAPIRSVRSLVSMCQSL